MKIVTLNVLRSTIANDPTAISSWVRLHIWLKISKILVLNAIYLIKIFFPRISWVNSMHVKRNGAARETQEKPWNKISLNLIFDLFLSYEWHTEKQSEFQIHNEIAVFTCVFWHCFIDNWFWTFFILTTCKLAINKGRHSTRTFWAMLLAKR